MILIRNTEVKQKSCEMNLKQRMYQKESIVTVQIMTEFFPTMIGTQLVSGAVEVNVDTNNIHSLSDLENKEYEGKVGRATISVCNEGIWEHNNLYDLKVKFGTKNKDEIPVTIELEDCKLEVVPTIVSLYTTSSTEKSVQKNFDMTEFYEEPMKREIGKNTILKYFVKREK